MIVVYAGTPDDWPFDTISTRIKRINKTHQILNPVWVLNAPFGDDLYSEINVYRQDGGGWHPLFKRFMDKMCSFWFDKDGMAHGVKMTFFPDLPDECPVKPAVYNMSPIIIPRYRKDWHPELQALIPPMVPSADKWRVDCKLFSAEKEQLGLLRFEFRLINRFSSQ